MCADFLPNNQVSSELALKAVTFGGALSITVFLALFSNYLANRRPAWPWIRSLPWSSLSIRKGVDLKMGALGLILSYGFMGSFDFNLISFMIE
ncbi:MAG TPA: hypothetical protein VFG01_06615 [Acidobacteriota bacterium]|nr:hypothetical protein [Acidobacteriota bacterium]